MITYACMCGAGKCQVKLELYCTFITAVTTCSSYNVSHSVCTANLIDTFSHIMSLIPFTGLQLDTFILSPTMLGVLTAY